MPKSAAHRLADAEGRMNNPSLSEREREIAAEDYVEAQKELLDKLGVERRSGSRLIGQVIAGVLVLAVLVSMALNVFYSVTASNTADTAREAVAVIREVQRENVADQREQCERQNDAREASVKEKRKDIYFTLRPALRLWKGVVEAQGIDPKTPPEVVERFNDFLQKLERGIHSKRVGIQQSLESIADVAEEPGSARADCDVVYPQHPVAFVTKLPRP